MSFILVLLVYFLIQFAKILVVYLATTKTLQLNIAVLLSVYSATESHKFFRKMRESIKIEKHSTIDQ